MIVYELPFAALFGASNVNFNLGGFTLGKGSPSITPKKSIGGKEIGGAYIVSYPDFSNELKIEAINLCIALVLGGNKKA